MVLDGSRVFKFRLLCDADELLDVVPLAFKEGGVVRNWVIGAVGCGDAAEDGKLLDFLGTLLEVREKKLMYLFNIILVYFRGNVYTSRLQK